MFNAIDMLYLPSRPSSMCKGRGCPYEPEGLDRWFAGQHPEGDVGRQVHGASLLAN